MHPVQKQRWQSSETGKSQNPQSLHLAKVGPKPVPPHPDSHKLQILIWMNNFDCAKGAPSLLTHANHGSQHLPGVAAFYPGLCLVLSFYLLCFVFLTLFSFTLECILSHTIRPSNFLMCIWIGRRQSFCRFPQKQQGLIPEHSPCQAGVHSLNHRPTQETCTRDLVSKVLKRVPVSHSPCFPCSRQYLVMRDNLGQVRLHGGVMVLNELSHLALCASHSVCTDICWWLRILQLSLFKKRSSVVFFFVESNYFISTHLVLLCFPFWVLQFWAS